MNLAIFNLKMLWTMRKPNLRNDGFTEGHAKSGCLLSE